MRKAKFCDDVVEIVVTSFRSLTFFTGVCRLKKMRENISRSQRKKNQYHS